MKLRLAYILSTLLACFSICSSTLAQTQSGVQPEAEGAQRILETLLTGWVVNEITDDSVPVEIVPDERAIAPNGLPDGRITTGIGDIAEAWYSEPTTRYNHAVLGDGIEAGALKIKNNRGETYTFRLPSTEVFEDIAPRLADLDGDGRTEVITILSSRTRGASVAIFHLNGNAFLKAAQTPFIGRSNRWLNIAEISNFTGDRRPDIAIVVTPHLSGILQFYRYQNGQLVKFASAPGFSNHFIGSNELRLSAVLDFNENRIPDLALPSLARNELLVVGIKEKQLDILGRIQLPARIDRPILVRQVDEKTQMVVGLDNGKIYAISKP